MHSINKGLFENLNILYVEDDVAASDEVSNFLRKYVKNVWTAYNGEEGLEVFASHPVDIIISDIQMPKMDGLEMISSLKSRSVPVILTTAYSDVDYFLKAIDLNINKYCIKPLQLDELMQGIQECILVQNAKDDLLLNKNLLKIIDENVLLSVTNTEGEIIEVSEAFCKLTGYSKEEFLGQNHSMIRHKDTEESVYTKLWKTLKEGEVYEGELQNVKKNGEAFWIYITITPTFKDNKVQSFVAIREDITNKKKLEQLAIVDELTSLYNRRYFNEIVDKEIRRAKRRQGLLNMVIIDIDYFKKYNDTYGHPQGDKVLIQISQLFQHILKRGDDYIFRIGGEEFCLLFSSQNEEESLSLTKRIVQSVEDLKIEHKKSSVSQYITISCGLSCVDSQNLQNDTKMYQNTDKALYKAKSNGRNQVVVYNETEHN